MASRRAAETLIEQGQVKVDGRVATLGMSADPREQVIEVSGKRLRRKPETMTVVLYKPRGYLTTCSDEKGRRTVMDLIKDVPERLVPVGRLDMDTEGLLLLSNDGALVQRLTHPSFAVEKEYWAWVKGEVESAIKTLSSPMTIEGVSVRPAKVHIERVLEVNTVLSITISEGRHHQVRLMCEQAGLTLSKLRRVRHGSLVLHGLKPGQWRKLAARELSEL